jgi:muconolactone delta-isomerase
MLFLVISTPRPERPSDVAATRQKFWPWIAKYQADGACRHIYARVGRGAVAVFDVPDNDTLHRILGEWAELVPAQFDTFPLVDGAVAQALLASQRAAEP